MTRECVLDETVEMLEFRAFERLRRRRVERIVAQGARSSSSKAACPFGRIGRVPDVAVCVSIRGNGEVAGVDVTAPHRLGEKNHA